MKKWTIAKQPPDDFINNHPKFHKILSQLLWNRDLKTQKEIDEFLNLDYSKDIHDPFLFNDMANAVKIVNKSLDENKKIIIYGDYDADGVTASAILVKTLRGLGGKNIDVFIPHREKDGYGLNLKNIELFKKDGVDLIITCDCGVSNFEEVELAKKYKIKTIITDHHSIPEKLPQADAIIHALSPEENYPDKGLAGAGVAFKLAQALLIEHKKNNKLMPDGQSHEGFEKWLLDLVAIATIGDMVPMTGESRILTHYGLKVLSKTKNIGLKQLIMLTNLASNTSKPKTLTSDMVSFQIVPRINAAGRMNHANSAFILLSTKEDKEASNLATELYQNNLDRQKDTEKIINEALSQVIDEKQVDNPILFTIGKDWSLGLVGLVAGKLKDRYNKPAIVMGWLDGQISGSGRSILQFNMIDAIRSSPELFEKFGGHPQACGFSLKSPEKLDEFKKIMIEKAAIATKGVDLAPKINIDAEIKLVDIGWEFYNEIQRLAPFGVKNEEPKYISTNLTLSEISFIGKDKKHLKIAVQQNSSQIFKAIAFNFGDSEKHPFDWKKNLNINDKIDIVFKININEWRGNRELQLMIVDIKKNE